VAEERLEMCVEIHVVINRVCELVQSGTVSHILIFKFNLNFVGLGLAQVALGQVYSVLGELY
jgi:hypothetical protein